MKKHNILEYKVIFWFDYIKLQLYQKKIFFKNITLYKTDMLIEKLFLFSERYQQFN